MQTYQDRDPFPCPFCGSVTPLRIGGNRVFLHYRCQRCSEVWTVTCQFSQGTDLRFSKRFLSEWLSRLRPR